MTDSIRSSRIGGTYLLQRAKSAGPSFRYKSSASDSQSKFKQQPTIVLYVDEHCPLHGSQGKCTCRSFITDEDDLENTKSLHQNGDFIQQQTNGNHENNNDIVPTNIKPFNNNPPLPHTQRDIVGNNLHFNSSSQINGFNNLNNEQLGSLILYHDVLKQNLTTPTKANGSFPRMRLGRSGGHWRHIQQTNSYSGSNLLYIDGAVRVDDSFKYPISQFGYPPMTRPQNTFSSSSNQDLSYKSSNPTTQSLDAVTWSLKDELNRRPSLSQYSNRYERHAKDGFAYWPTDLYYKKPRSKKGTTGTYKTWLGLSDAILKL